MALQDMAFEAFDSNVKAEADSFTVLGRDGIGLYFKHSTFLSIEFSSTDQ